MLITVHFSLLLALIIITLIFIFISLSLVTKIRSLRLKINQLLEEKAKTADELDRYIDLAQNPLGPLYARDTKPLILSFNNKGIITDVNDQLLQKFGYTKTQLIGKKALGTILPEAEKTTDSIIYRLFQNPNLFIDAETEAQTKAGNRIWISWTNKIIYDKKGNATAVNAVGFDITKRKEMEAELQYLSSIDPQTGVMNRPALLQTGTTELKRAKRYGRALSVVVFKFQQKEGGTSLSDAQLQEAAHLARTVVRSVDYLGRIGDTEFALILPETTVGNVTFLIQRLSQHLAQYNKENGNKMILLYASAALNKKTDTIDNLLSQAWKQLNTKPKKGLK